MSFTYHKKKYDNRCEFDWNIIVRTYVDLVCIFVLKFVQNQLFFTNLQFGSAHNIAYMDRKMMGSVCGESEQYSEVVEPNFGSLNKL